MVSTFSKPVIISNSITTTGVVSVRGFNIVFVNPPPQQDEGDEKWAEVGIPLLLLLLWAWDDSEYDSEYFTFTPYGSYEHVDGFENYSHGAKMQYKKDNVKTNWVIGKSNDKNWQLTQKSTWDNDNLYFEYNQLANQSLVDTNVLFLIKNKINSYDYKYGIKTSIDSVHNKPNNLRHDFIFGMDYIDKNENISYYSSTSLSGKIVSSFNVNYVMRF